MLYNFLNSTLPVTVLYFYSRMGLGADDIMKVKIFKYWDEIRSSFWFIPIVMAIGAVALSFISVSIDAPIMKLLQRYLGWVFTGGAQGATTILGTVAGSMITIAGVVFSMTLVTLSLASSQFGSRMLRNFMSDTTTQVVLGSFVATFLYCLLVLRTIRQAEDVDFVPHLSVSLSVLLAVFNVGVLIYFIHHVSISIQANEIIAKISKESIDGIERLFPKLIKKDIQTTHTEPNDTDFMSLLEEKAYFINAQKDGYLQFIDSEVLSALAEEEDLLLELKIRPGDYVVANQLIILAWPKEQITDELINKIKSAFTQGNQRTPRQDIESTLKQLVEIAVRALSPGLNDPFTAITCIDYLGSTLCRLAQREMPSPYTYDKHNQLRVIAPAIIFSMILDTSFDQIRQYGQSSVSVRIRLLETIATIAEFAHRKEDRIALNRHADMIARGTEELSENDDLWKIKEIYQTTKLLLNEKESSS